MDFETMMAFYKFSNQVGMEINQLSKMVNELQQKLQETKGIPSVAGNETILP